MLAQCAAVKKKTAISVPPAIGYKAAQSGGEFFRFDEHTLQFVDPPSDVNMVSRFDFKFDIFGWILKIKHLPWNSLQ